jgi:erythritol kinase
VSGGEGSTGPLRLGIDLGTSSVKAALFDSGGAAVQTAWRPVTLDHLQGGRVEQDPQRVVVDVSGVVSELLAEVPARRVEAVAVTGQGDGCWLTDAEGLPTRSAVSWMDGRAASIVSDWAADGTLQRVFDVSGNVLFPGVQGAILRWMAQYESSSLERAETAGYCKDMVFTRLTGVRATDPSDASVPFGNVSGDGYCAEVIDACGLTRWSSLLAPIVRPLPQAPLSGDGGHLLGLPAGIPVTAGPFDLPSCAVGAGVTDVGDGLLVVGTSLGCQVVVDSAPHPAGRPHGMTIATSAPDRRLRVQATMLGCASLDWLLRTLGMTHDEIDYALESTAPGAGGAEALPYLAPSGERAPFVATAAAGQFTGIRLTTTRYDLVRALCESLAFAARECFEATGRPDHARLAVCGGGSRSLPWLRIFATVLRSPLSLARLPEVGARGAVLSAVQAGGGDVDVAEWTAPSATIAPEESLLAFYDDAYQRYLSQRRSAAVLWRS